MNRLQGLETGNTLFLVCACFCWESHIFRRMNSAIGSFKTKSSLTSRAAECHLDSQRGEIVFVCVRAVASLEKKIGALSAPILFQNGHSDNADEILDFIRVV